MLITVLNANPIVLARLNKSPQEGEVVRLNATFTDAGADDTHTADIFWGDGTFEPVEEITLTETPGNDTSATTGTVQASHIYDDSGQFTITACVADDDHKSNATVPVNGEGCDTLEVTVANAPPTLDPISDRLTAEGFGFTMGPVTFSDPGFDIPSGGSAEDFTATINWGDGNIEPTADLIIGEVPGVEGTATTGTIQAIHHYGDDGEYTVEVCIRDDDMPSTEASVCQTSKVRVFNVAPTIDAGVDQDADESTFIELDPVTSSDPGFGNTAPEDTS